MDQKKIMAGGMEYRQPKDEELLDDIIMMLVNLLVQSHGETKILKNIMETTGEKLMGLNQEHGMTLYLMM